MSGSEELQDAIALLQSSRPPVGFFFDFDGVLAPIQDNPDASAPEPETLAGLYRLAELTGRVSIVSARPVSFLSRHIDPRRRVTLFGLYGLERCDPDGEPATDSDALRWAPLVFLGEASYSLYMVHAPVQTVFFAISAKLGITGAANPLLAVAAYLAGVGIAVLASIILFKLVEAPARDGIARAILHRKRPLPIEPAL